VASGIAGDLARNRGGGGPEGVLVQESARSRRDRRRLSVSWGECYRGTCCAGGGGVDELVRRLRQAEVRDTACQRRQQRPRAGVRDDQRAVVQDQGLSDISLDADVGRLRPKFGGVAVAADRDQEVHLQGGKGGDSRMESRCPVLDGPEGEVDERTVDLS